MEMTDRQQAGQAWWLRHPAWVLCLIWVVLCGKWIAGSRTIPYDATQQFFPAVSFVAQQLRDLQWPWWNPYLFGGYPQLADPQMMSFQPTMVLPMMLAPASLHLFGIVVMMHVLLAGIGALRLGRHYRWEPPASLLFAMVWMFGGVMASRLQHTPMIISATMLPWLWLYLSRVKAHGRWRDTVFAGVWGGLITLQLTQVTYFIIVACMVYAGSHLLMASGQRLRLTVQWTAIGLIAAVLSSPQWLSTFAYLPFTNRTALDLADSANGSIKERALLTLLSGNFFEQGRGQYWGHGDITQDYLYVGAVPLAIWLTWGGAVIAAQRGRVAIALAVLLFTVLFALGTHAPLFPWLHGWFPGLTLFRRPADLLFLSIPAVAWLAAAAFQARIDGAAVRPHWSGIAVLLVMLAYGLWVALVKDPHPRTLLWLFASGVLAAGAVTPLLVERWKSSTRVLLLVVVVAALDYRAFNTLQSFNTGARRYSVLTAPIDGAPQRAYAELEKNLRRSGIPLRAEVQGIPPFLNGAAVHRLPLVNGYNPMFDLRYAKMTGLGPYPPDSANDVRPTPWAPARHAPLWDLLGLNVTVASTAFEGSVPAGNGQIHVAWRNVGLPRVLNPTEVKRYEKDLPAAAAFNQTDFRKIVWLPRTQEASECVDSGAGIAELAGVRYQANRIDIDYVADAPAWLVINEVIAPGWRAEANGRRIPLLRGNALFRAVCVPAGQARLSLRYSPLQLWRDGYSAWQAETP